MGILEYAFAIGLVALGGCYSPAVRDCLVSCTSPGDCVSGQICGDDGLCAIPKMAGRCASLSSDAGLPGDPTTNLDGSITVRLQVRITGEGSVAVEGRGTCSSQGSQRGDCTYDIAPGIVQHVQAIEIRMNEPFTRWTSTTCIGQSASCTFIPLGPTSITARFESGGPYELD